MFYHMNLNTYGFNFANVKNMDDEKLYVKISKKL